MRFDFLVRPKTSNLRMRFCSPWNTSGSDSSRRLADFRLCWNWWLLWVFRRVIFPVPVILNRFAAVLFVLIFGIFLLLSSGRWLSEQNHGHHSSFHLRSAFDDRDICHKFSEPVQLLPPEFRVSDLTGPEHTRHFNFVALSNELPCFSDTSLDVVFRNTRTNLYTLYFLLGLLFVISQFRFQVFMLAVVDDSTYRWVSIWGNHHKVKALFSGQCERGSTLHDAKLLVISINHTNFAEPEHTLVDGRTRIGSIVSSKSLDVRNLVPIVGRNRVYLAPEGSSTERPSYVGQSREV